MVSSDAETHELNEAKFYVQIFEEIDIWKEILLYIIKFSDREYFNVRIQKMQIHTLIVSEIDYLYWFAGMWC